MTEELKTPAPEGRNVVPLPLPAPTIFFYVCPVDGSLNKSDDQRFDRSVCEHCEGGRCE